MLRLRVFMKKIKFKVLGAIILALGINIYSLDIFANPTTKNNASGNSIEEESDQDITSGYYKSTILDGEIGEWDPIDNPRFNDVEEIEGNIPQKYYTISATVPITMEFYVLPNSHLVNGSFFSPTYTIKNNGTKSISVNIKSFKSKENNSLIQDKSTTTLYIEPVDSTDKQTQMELSICSIDLLTKRIIKKIDLTNFKNPEKLCVLGTNEEKGVKFLSTKWELPQNVSNKKKALSNHKIVFEFYIDK